jgi:hypothetical protein
MRHSHRFFEPSRIQATFDYHVQRFRANREETGMVLRGVRNAEQIAEAFQGVVGFCSAVGLLR